MLFNSIEFGIFLPLAFTIYWLIGSHNRKIQNVFLVLASYTFYGMWNWRFLVLIAFSSVLDYVIGLQLNRNCKTSSKKLLLSISLLINLGFLAFFKYFNFFIDSFIDTFTFFGASFDPIRLSIILPVGISFYTFQTLSYSIDIYRGKLAPTNSLIDFLAFVSFFPQLVAGPIERASKLLPQFEKSRSFNIHEAIMGLKQILWGLFKKMVIADNCAQFVNMVFENHHEYHGSTLLLGAILFSFQIYGDFSGYSDIAIGTAKLFGFKLMKNFAFPYFSRDVAEFWRRWHISLSTWFRDYLYIQLGGSKGGFGLKVRNTFIIFLVSGLWHGANWTFVAWGVVHALLFIPLLLLKKNREHVDDIQKLLPSVKEAFQITATFLLVSLSWVFFRAQNIKEAFLYLKKIFSSSILTIDKIDTSVSVKLVLMLVTLFSVIEWIGRNNEFAIEKIGDDKPWIIRWSYYALIISLIGIYMHTEETPFIYFQF